MAGENIKHSKNILQNKERNLRTHKKKSWFWGSSLW